MDVQLISSGLSDLQISTGDRSVGVHASTLISRICVRMGHYDDRPDEQGIPDKHRIVGHAIEDAICRGYEREYPGEFAHNPEIRIGGEDGIYLTPDLVWIARQSDVEIKATWMSEKNGPGSDKFWKYEIQLKTYLAALRKVFSGRGEIRLNGTKTWKRYERKSAGSSFLSGYLRVLFINDYRDQDEQIPCWRYTFEARELDLAWALLLEEKDAYKLDHQAEGETK